MKYLGDFWPGPIFLSMRTCREFVSHSQPIRFVRLDSEHAQSDGKSMKRGPFQRSRVLVLSKESATSGDENDFQHKKVRAI